MGLHAVRVARQAHRLTACSPRSALLHAQKLVAQLAPIAPKGKNVILLVSHDTPMRNDTDREMPHRPESK